VLTQLVLALQRTPLQSRMKIWQVAHMLILGHTQQTGRRTDVVSALGVLFFYLVRTREIYVVFTQIASCLNFQNKNAVFCYGGHIAPSDHILGQPHSGFVWKGWQLQAKIL
jgi:hypothetical protein